MKKTKSKPENSPQEKAGGDCPRTTCSGSSRLTDVETELRKMTASLSAAGISSGATVLRMAADIVAMSGRQAAALHAIAHCDDLVIRGEDDGPELARRLRFAVNTAEAALSGQNAIGEARADNATSPHDQTL